MRASFVALFPLLALAVAYPDQLTKRVPKYDIYLYEETDCQGDYGHMCEETEADRCCYRTGDPDWLFASADYGDAGSTQRSDVAQIRGYTKDGTNYCHWRITQDDKCATHSFGVAFSGAMVYAGSETPTRKRGEGAVEANKIFYKEGNRRWTIDVDSDKAKGFSASNQKKSYLKMNGKLDILEN
ncbi:hypothetical protein K491DRAFT_683523 [Lophiostoma macrostomum CBS 122681]|uniref:Uncharacterized protein n=1 Tax=Lophiostoma macrostomum CBS 122681 TaxID=1314788 RepID=A0A6A6SUG2_9PLEO|nr:hypothetical protein K491DRAFT_683523 [Lophiostoma macrostomum CBS 122681]